MYVLLLIAGAMGIYSIGGRLFGFVPWTAGQNGRGIFSPPVVERQWMHAWTKVLMSDVNVVQKYECRNVDSVDPVSYTHLTLPTILLV